jgi:hypothetical protein
MGDPLVYHGGKVHLQAQVGNAMHRRCGVSLQWGEGIITPKTVD